MSQPISNLIRVATVPILGTTLLVSNPTLASEMAQLETSLDRINFVTDLSDVNPTDWAYSALENLAQRYNCLLAYPDGTYRGNRAMTRYEFAAGLNQCLNTIQTLIQQAGSDINSDDIETLLRLQQEFTAELEILRDRVNALEIRTAELEANQFSTTTKLTGEAIFTLTDAFSSNDNNQTAFQQRVRLNFNTSFTGQDLLITRLQVGNSSPLNLESTNQGVEFFTSTSESFPTNQVFGDTGNTVTLDTLQYQFSSAIKLGYSLPPMLAFGMTLPPPSIPYLKTLMGAAVLCLHLPKETRFIASVVVPVWESILHPVMIFKSP
jgi:hypothetical protein